MPAGSSRSTRALIAALVFVAGCSKEAPTTVSTPGAATAPGESLAKAKGCLVCHGIDKAILGPAYRDVAKRYAADSDAVARLVKKVKGGGNGAWGTPPMPPQAQVTDAETKTIVEWVLSLR